MRWTLAEFLLPQCLPPARHLHRSDGENISDDDVGSLARDGLQDMGQLLQLSGRELLRINHVESDSITDIAVAVPQMFNEVFSDAELHIRNEERHRDGPRPSVGHLDQPVHPVHSGVAPDTNLLWRTNLLSIWQTLNGSKSKFLFPFSEGNFL